jgi:glycosyltransferase involved in cell wall biosynthesis
LEYNSLYAAFDLYPSSKGAATHIHQMSKALFSYCGNGYLYVLGNDRLPAFQDEGNVKILRFKAPIANYLQRAEAYGAGLSHFVSACKNLRLVHFRDIWSGLALLGDSRPYKALYEVNALLSIELPYRYPLLNKNMVQKIREIELYCMDKSDALVCPSHSIKANLIKMGVASEKIDVITNGADATCSFEPVVALPDQYILYFGALQYWQGVDDLIKAFAGLKDYTGLKLVICSSNRPAFSKPYKKLSEKLGVANSMVWHHQLPKETLNTWIKNARLTVAPMKETERNLVQGFSPIKIFESMAMATPVVASNLPSVCEIITDKENGCLVRPERPSELSRTIRFLLDYPEYAREIGIKAQQHVLKNYTWKQKIDELKVLYSKLIKFEDQ